MKLRIKKGSEKKVRDPILEIQLRHGDVVTMCDTRLQDFTEVSWEFPLNTLLS